MTTEEFFALIYGQGYRIIALKNRNGKGFSHSYFEDNKSAAEYALAQDAAGRTVYHACSTFITPDSRKADNVSEVRAFWLDIDCGAGKEYDNFIGAIKAVTEFRNDVGLPKFTLIQSGSGLHVYWPLEDSVSMPVWYDIASKLKRAARKFGLHADPTRTADAASVLRPVGTHNRKTGEPQPVKCLARDETTNHKLIDAALSEYLGDEPTEVLDSKPNFINNKSSDDLSIPTHTGGVYNLDLLVSKCGAIREFADKRGNLPEPAWYHAMGVVSKVEDGRKHCHALSMGHPGYSKSETDHKLNQLEAVGPTTCQVLEGFFGNNCATCAFRGKVKSPIQLARVHEVVDPETKQVSNPTTGKPLFVAPSWMPYGFRATTINGVTGIYYDKQKGDDDEDDGKPICVSRSVFYPISALRTEDNTFQMRIKAFFKNGESREFTMANKIIGAGGRELAASLADNQIAISESGQRYAAQYLRAWMAHQANELDAVSTYNRFGWHGDDFVIGGTLLSPHQKPKQIVLSDSAESYSEKFKAKGTVEGWVSTVDKLYNVPGREGLQFLVLCAFAAPIVHMIGNTGGILVYGHSDQSGVGKTTAERAMLSVYGTWKGLETAYGRTTDNAFNDLLGVMGNLPVMIDELTNIETKKVSDFVHSISQGQSKARLQRNGKPSKKQKTSWETIVVGSGNVRLTDRLASIKGNPDAEMARIFEFTLPSLKKSLSLSETAKLVRELEENVGVVGIRYLQYLVDNRAGVAKLLENIERRLDTKYSFKPNERFWSRLMGVVLTAQIITRKLELTQFGILGLEKWLGDTLNELRQNVTMAVDDVRSRFNRMYADLTPDLLITVGDGQGNSEAMVLRQPRGAISGRVVVPPSGPGAANCAPRLWITENAIRKWCNEHSVSFRQTIEDFKVEGLTVRQARVSIGKGVQDHAAIKRERVVEFDPGLVGVGSGSNLLTVVAGGKT